jgi:predicted alpha/beta hydrolase family esterase
MSAGSNAVFPTAVSTQPSHPPYRDALASSLAQFRVLVVPGLNNSGAGHWQTRWQELFPPFARVEQDDWDEPDLATWSERLAQALDGSARPTIVIAHSFGCLATVHRTALGTTNIAGALLVAPADPAKFGVEPAVAVPPSPFPSTVIGSENDPWLTLEGARHWAHRWGSEFINAGSLGHINAESQLGDWPFGLALLHDLVKRIGSG